MKKLLLFLGVICFANLSYSQPAGLLDETFNLKYLKVGDIYYTPNGENPNFTIFENSGDYSVEAGGIFNMLSGSVIFNSNNLTLHVGGIPLHDCQEPNCYYENLYFYEILSTLNLQPKTLTYQYRETNGVKTLRLTDSNYNMAFFSNATNLDPDPLLFQTWYLYMTEVDLGDPEFYEGIHAPQITINPDMIYTGKDGCALISGDLIFSGLNDYWDFTLQSRNYVSDESNCTDGSPIYAMHELETDMPLGGMVYRGSDGIDYFQYEFYAGFISYFSNQRLSTPENQLTELVIFPNPAKDWLYIKSNLGDLTSISVMDINGRTVFSENMKLDEVDVSSLTSGMYFIRIESPFGNITKKFIKF